MNRTSKRPVPGEWTMEGWNSHILHHPHREEFKASNPNIDLQVILDPTMKSNGNRLVEIAVGLHLTAAGFRVEKLPEHANKEVDYQVDGGAFFVEVTHLSPHSEEYSSESFYDELIERLTPTAEARRICIGIEPQSDFDPHDVRMESALKIADRIRAAVTNMPDGGGNFSISAFGMPPVDLKIEVHPVNVVGFVAVPFRSFGPAFGGRNDSDSPNRRLGSRIQAKRQQLLSRTPVILVVFAEGSYTDRMEMDIEAHHLEAGSDPLYWPGFDTTAGILLMNHDRECSVEVDRYCWRANPGFHPQLTAEVIEHLRAKRV